MSDSTQSARPMVRFGSVRFGSVRFGSSKCIAGLLVVLAGQAMNGCMPVQPAAQEQEEPTGEVKEEASAFGITRIIPIRFVEMLDNGSGMACDAACNSPVCVTTLFGQQYPDSSPCDPANPCSAAGNVPISDYQIAVDKTNQVYRSAGIQFVISSIDRYSMPKAKDFNPINQLVRWDNVRSELRQAFPSLNCNQWQHSDLYPNQVWSDLVTTQYANTGELTVLVTSKLSSKAARGRQPWCGNEVIISPSILSDIPTANGSNPNMILAHEIGHFLGLPHAMGRDPSAYISPTRCDDGIVGRPGDPSAGWYNPESSRGVDGGTPQTYEEYWDLAFTPGPGGTVTTYNRREALGEAGAPDSGLLPIERYNFAPPDGGSPCPNIPDIDAGNSSCTRDPATSTIICDLNGSCYSTGVPELGGVAFSYAGDNPTIGNYVRGRNIMAYDNNPAMASLSASQIEQIQRVLRYDIEVISYDNGRTEDVPTGLGGKRPMLGRTPFRPVTYQLDFDGDGKRDLGVYTPPTVAGGVGQWKILKSSSSPPYSGVLTMSFGGLGDVAIPADYNGDGLTDFAVWRTQGPNGTDATDSNAYWIICTSSWITYNGVQYPMHSCGSPTSYQFGQRTNVPLIGHRFNSSVKNALATYDRSSGDVKWKLTGSLLTNTIATGFGGYAYQPLADDYDGDQLADLVFYKPTTAEFKMRLSTSSWGTTTTRTFPSHVIANPMGATSAEREGGILTSAYVACSSGCTKKRVLQMYTSHNYDYLTMWDPVNSSTLQTCNFTNNFAPNSGVTGGLPVSGFVDRDGDGKSDPIMQSAGTNLPDNANWGRLYFGFNSCIDNGVILGSTTNTWSERAVAIGVEDMNGDGKAELVVYEPDSATYNVLWSPGYSSITEYQLGTVLSAPL